MPWIDACAADDIDAEEAKRFDHGGRTFAIFRNDADEYFCTDGLCTHEADSPRRWSRHGEYGGVPQARVRLRLHDWRGGDAARLRESEDLQDEGRERPRHGRDLSIMGQPFQLAACAEMLWRDRPIAWRAARLHELGFGVGLWNWPDHDLDALEKTGATFTIMNGYLEGRLADDEGADILLESARQTAKVGKRLGVARLNLHGTGLGEGGIPIVKSDSRDRPDVAEGAGHAESHL